MTKRYVKNLNEIFIYPLNIIHVPNLSSVGCFEAELESLTPPDAGRMPGETKANPSTA